MSSEGASSGAEATSEAGPGLLLVLSAPSGAGKTTLAHRFRAAHPDAVFSISATTRAPRGAEKDGVDYHFVPAARFAELVAQGAFAEWAEVHGQRYGTLRATVDEDGVVHLAWERSASTIGLESELHRSPETVSWAREQLAHGQCEEHHVRRVPARRERTARAEANPPVSPWSPH